MLPTLRKIGVNLTDMLTNKELVQAYDTHIRDALLSETRNAEYLVRKHMQKNEENIYLPKSFSADDSRELLQRYVASAEPMINFVKLIETAPVNKDTGVDAKLKLLAKRRKNLLAEKLLKDHQILEIGCEVGISKTQAEEVKEELNGTEVKLTYSEKWLNQTLDNPSILNNFQHLFEFTDNQVLLTLAAYSEQITGLENIFTSAGKKEYQIGTAYNLSNIRSFSQTCFYRNFLESNNIDLELVISWFFEVYLVEEFKVLHFSFDPSDSGSPYLHRIRHLFAC